MDNEPKHFKDKAKGAAGRVKAFIAANGRSLVILALLTVMAVITALIVVDRVRYFDRIERDKKAANLYTYVESETTATPRPLITPRPTAEPTEPPDEQPAAIMTAEPTATPEPTPEPTPTPRPIGAGIQALRDYYENDDIVAYLKIPGTTVDNPVVQSADNSYYLERTIEGEIFRSGTLFIDYRNDMGNDGEFNTVVYGHNMKEPYMFHDLRNYVDKSYFENHRYIVFDTLYQKGVWEIFAFVRIRDWEKEVYYNKVLFADRDEYFAIEAEMKAKSMYETGVEIGKNDRVLTLSTCTSVLASEANSRFVVVARLITDPDDIPEWLR